MTRENLASASDRLDSAAESTSDDDAAERLRDLADQLESFAEGDRGPDHGRLARIQTALGDLADDTGSDVAAEIEAANDDVVAYRETVEGV